ncbi:MAG: penicillin-binding protein, partial [Pauljensenia sp.]|nr:penicillin-binding protein [Pauljensenia sp.]
FGQSGSFVWADRDLGASAAFVGAEPFGQWHHDNWSVLNASLLSLARERA